MVFIFLSISLKPEPSAVFTYTMYALSTLQEIDRILNKTENEPASAHKQHHRRLSRMHQAQHPSRMCLGIACDISKSGTLKYLLCISESSSDY